MPYIEEERRKELDHLMDTLKYELVGRENAGDYNYVISKLLWSYWYGHRSYIRGNEIVGILECAKQEFIRRKLAPYENSKLQTNGDL